MLIAAADDLNLWLVTGWVVTGVLVILFPLVLLGQPRRDPASVKLWAMSGVVGILFGVIGGYSVITAMGYEYAELQATADATRSSLTNANMQGSSPPSAAPKGMKNVGPRRGQDKGGPPSPESMFGSSKAAKGMKGGRKAMDDLMKKRKKQGKKGLPRRRGSGVGGFGGFTPSSKRSLTSYVRKLNILTGNVKIQLTDEQKKKLTAILTEISEKSEISDDDAKAALEKLEAVLTAEQKSKQESVGLPFTGRRRRGGGGGNPFATEANSKALSSLMTKLEASAQKSTKKPTKVDKKKAAPPQKKKASPPVKKASKKAAPTKKVAPAKKATPAKKAAPKKAAAKKAAPVKKDDAKKAPAKKGEGKKAASKPAKKK